MCLLFGAGSLAIGGLGAAGVGTASELTRTIGTDELGTALLMVDVGRASQSAQLGTQALLLTGGAADRAARQAAAVDQPIQDVETKLADLRVRLAAGGTALQADLQGLQAQWSVARGAVSLALAASSPDSRAGAVTGLAAAFDEFDGRLGRLAQQQQADASVNEHRVAAGGNRIRIGLIVAVGLSAAASVICGRVAVRRIRRAVEPAEDQVGYADILQLAQNEEEAHLILQRHLEAGLGEGAVTILNRNNSADRLEAMTAVPPESVLATTLPHARPSSCFAVRSGRQHIEDESRPGLLRCPVCGPCPGLSACSPLTVGGAVIGAVLVNGRRVLDPSYVERVHDSVGQAAPVLANLRNLAIAEVRASTDALTALPNKRTVNETLMRMLAQATRSLTPMCLLTLDLDHFKQVNDRFGHPVGDQALAAVGAVLRAALRTGDFAGRNGGEEFSVMLPDTDLAGATVVAEKIRAGVSEIVLPGINTVLTVSIGVAAYPEHALTSERLERLADSALYVAKHGGRNRVEIASVTAEPPGPPMVGAEPPAPAATPSIRPTVLFPTAG